MAKYQASLWTGQEYVHSITTTKLDVAVQTVQRQARADFVERVVLKSKTVRSFHGTREIPLWIKLTDDQGNLIGRVYRL